MGSFLETLGEIFKGVAEHLVDESVQYMTDEELIEKYRDEDLKWEYKEKCYKELRRRGKYI